jgi:hypothetical protein
MYSGGDLSVCCLSHHQGLSSAVSEIGTLFVNALRDEVISGSSDSIDILKRSAATFDTATATEAHEGRPTTLYIHERGTAALCVIRC